MAEDARITKSSFEFWLHKAHEWGQITTPESQQDVCLHLHKLQEFLLQIYGALKHMNCTDAVQKFPLIGQLLGRLCWNPFVIGHDECQKILMWCLCCLYSGEPQNPVELKANRWIQILLCHLLSFSGLGHHDSNINNFIATLGLTSVDYYIKLLENVISSLVRELSRNWFNRFNSQQSISLRVRSVSLLCVPLINLPEITPLLEALLNYHGDGSKEVLHCEFLEAVNEAILQKKISLSESAVVQLWLRHLPSLEKALLQNFESLIFGQSSSVEEMIHLIKSTLLPQAACHPAIFRTIEEIFKNALLETNGAPEVMTIMQVFTRCFLQAYQENNKQHKFPLKAYFPQNPNSLLRAFLKQPSDLPAAGLHQHLIYIAETLKAVVETKCMRSCGNLFETWFLFIHFGEWADTAAEHLLVSNAESSGALLWLLAFYYDPNVENRQRTQTVLEGRSLWECLTTLSRTPALSARDLQAEVNSQISKRQPATKELVLHLIISFLLFTANGHTIAREFIAHFAVTYDEIRRISSLLSRIAHRVSQLNVKYQRTVKLANDLLQILKSVG
ncbi:Fanconi anemia group C protein [Heteronotia binoei]|uniref:Fanconi anemia group C protein n=1 Tax=Heteronotia binoei TaxID=13085 RepID=UPI0029308724|nr:Fanconi anemia group C protein [Heteronotia binoei]XP_060091437.1 Fanconi anemia group C protein [Heteronotia binoei]XP_060091438.1 Fanconi anemia group C protein [Heteronotia binoei]